MNPWFSALILLLLGVLQVTAGPQLALWQAYPHLVLVAVVTWTMLRGGFEGIRWAILGGVVLGILSSAPLGTHLLALVVVAYGVGAWQRTVSHANPLWPMLAVSLGSLVFDMVLVAVLALTGHGLPLARTMVESVLPGAAYSGALALPGYYLCRLLDRRFPLPVQPGW